MNLRCVWSSIYWCEPWVLIYGSCRSCDGIFACDHSHERGIYEKFAEPDSLSIQSGFSFYQIQQFNKNVYKRTITTWIIPYSTNRMSQIIANGDLSVRCCSRIQIIVSRTKWRGIKSKCHDLCFQAMIIGLSKVICRLVSFVHSFYLIGESFYFFPSN